MYNNTAFGHNYNEGMIDRLLGKAYLTVKEVHDNLESIKNATSITEDNKEVAQVLDKLNTELESFEQKAGAFIGHDLGEVGVKDDPNSFIGDNWLSAIAKSYDNINTVGSNIETVKLLGIHINELKAVAESLSRLVEISEKADQVENIYSHINAIDANSDNISDISSVAQNLDNISKLAANIETFPKLLESKDDISKVADYLSSLVVCASNVETYLEANKNLKAAQEVLENENLPKLADSADNINTVANDLTNIDTVAANMKDIKKVTTITGFDDVSAISTQVSELQTEVDTVKANQETLTSKDTELQGKIDTANTSIAALKGSADVIKDKSDLTGLNTRVSNLEANASSGSSGSGSSAEVDLTNYVTKADLNTKLVNYDTTKTITTKLTNYVTNDALTGTLADYAKKTDISSGTGTTVDLSDYATKASVDKIVGTATITTGSNDINGLDSRLKTLESASSSSSGSSTAAASDILPSGWFPYFGEASNIRCTGIRHEIKTVEEVYTWTVPEDCWIVIEGKGGTTSGKDSEMYARLSYGVDVFFDGIGSNTGDNIYMYTTGFAKKGSVLKITMNNLTWVYLAHTAIYYDAGHRPASDTPTE